MKRINNLHSQLYQEDNIILADNNARRGKKSRYGINLHDKKKLEHYEELINDFKECTYKTSNYTTFKIYEPKERIIYRLPYYPDRIAHHALMNVLEPIWSKIFIDQTYSCLKNRGIHKCAKDVYKCLNKHPEETTYCLEIDVHKFYPSINHDILKQIIRRKIKDIKLLKILDEIIDSTEGVPIGNYLSQYFANLYLAYFDHWIKEEIKCKYYFRYADDIRIFSNNKVFLHNVLIAIKFYLKYNLKLELKPNYRVFPVEKIGVDFVGYVFFHDHVLLRKSIKNRLKKLLAKYTNGKINFKLLQNKIQAYLGWLKYCNSKNLLKKIEKCTGISISNWNGKQVPISLLKDTFVLVVNIEKHNKYNKVEFIYKNKPYYFLTTKQFNINNLPKTIKM